MSHDSDTRGVDLVPQLLACAVAAERAYNPGFPLVVFAQDLVELGASQLTVQIALDAERAQTQKPAGFWFAELARLHAMLARRDDVERLAAKCEAALSDDLHACATLAVAFEWLSDSSRADAYVARVRAPDRALGLAAMLKISARAARVSRAELLVERPELRHAGFRADLAGLRLEVARAHARAGDGAAATQWLDRAAELLAPPKGYQPNVDIAIAAAELGDVQRALDLARAVERATLDRSDPYSSTESLDLASAFAAAGDQKKVDKIVSGYVAFFGKNTTLGFSRAALACARFGRVRGVAKLLYEAEARLADSNTPDASRSVLARAYAANGQVVPAITHAAAIAGPDNRAGTLVSIATFVRGRRFEETPDLTAALQSLGATDR